jgi:general secretion pathway protein C
MNTLFKKMIHLLLPIFLLTLVAYLLNLGLFIYLPKEKPIVSIDNETNLEYKRYNVTIAFTKPKEKKTIPQNIPKKKTEYQLLSNIKLIAIYDLGNGKGVITITSQGSNDSVILANSEEFKGYVLDSVYRDYVVFTKNNKEYRVTLDDKDTPKFTTTPATKTQETKISEIEQSIQNIDDNNIRINRDYMNNYINDVSKIWKDIAIREHKVNGKIVGFKINRIKKASAFEKLGLKRGDILKSVNNIDLNSYNAAFSLYNKIEQTQAVHIVLIRNKQEVEINYEIE